MPADSPDNPGSAFAAAVLGTGSLPRGDRSHDLPMVEATPIMSEDEDPLVVKINRLEDLLARIRQRRRPANV